MTYMLARHVSGPCMKLMHVGITCVMYADGENVDSPMIIAVSML